MTFQQFLLLLGWGGGGGEGDAMENFPKSRTRYEGGWGYKQVPV